MGQVAFKGTAMFLLLFLGLLPPFSRAQWYREDGKLSFSRNIVIYSAYPHKPTCPNVPGPSTPPGFGLREAIKTRQSRSYETATFADLIGRSMGGVSPQIYWYESSICPSFRYSGIMYTALV